MHNSRFDATDTGPAVAAAAAAAVDDDDDADDDDGDDDDDDDDAIYSFVLCVSTGTAAMLCIQRIECVCRNTGCVHLLANSSHIQGYS